MAALFFTCSAVLAKPAPTNFSPSPIPFDAPAGGGNYTGLVVETSGFPVSRSTSPHVYDETGRMVFGLVPGPNGAVRGQNVGLAMRIGVAGYDYSLSKALSDKRVGPRPLVVHIVNINSAPGNWYPKDVVVSRNDADKILAANANARFIQKFKVVFVVDPANL